MKLNRIEEACTFVCLLVVAVLVAVDVTSLAAQEPDTTVLETVVITANRLETPRTAVVASVSIIRGEELRAQGVGTVAEALRMLPGVSVVETGSFGSSTSLFMRGGESDYVKVLVDGVPVNEPGGSYDFADLTLVNVERIEIVRGPTSVLYGTDAIAGVIQIFTKRERGRPRIEAGVRGGTHASVRVDANALGGTDRFNFGIGAERSFTDGVYEFNSDYDNLVFSGSLSAKIDDRTGLVLSGRYGSSEFHFPTDGSGNVADRNAYQTRDQISGALHVSRFLTRAIEARTQLSLSRSARLIDDQPDDAVDTLGFFAYSSDGTAMRVGADVGVNLHLSSRTVLSSGVHIEKQSERSAGESSSQYGPSSDSLDVKRTTRGYYLQLQLDPDWIAVLNGGLRVDDSDGFGTFVTYRFGTAVRFGSGSTLRGSLGRGFKEPSFFENYADNPFAVGNPDLRPERSTMWEIGLEQAATVLGSAVSATYFDQRFNDLIQYNAAPLVVGEPNYVNVAAARSSGLEVEARAVVAGRLHVRASYTYLRTEVTDTGFDTGPDAAFVEGEPLLRRPKHRAGANVRYHWTRAGVLAVNLDYVGGREDRDFSGFPAQRVDLPAYLKLDLSGDVALLGAGPGRPGISVSGRIDNLLDREYQEIIGFPARGRVIFLGVRIGN